MASKVIASARAIGVLHCYLSINNKELDKRQFWQIEDCSNRQTYTKEESLCEEYFCQTTRRDAQGHFIVKLSAKENELERLGETKSIAISRFYSLERKFRQQSGLKREYVKFVKEYSTLGHMRKITDGQETIHIIIHII